MTELKTKQSLLSALEKAASRPLTAEEVEKQRVSFIMGILRRDSTVTRSQVEEALAQLEGKRAAG
jgi:hypothetical protein